MRRGAFSQAMLRAHRALLALGCALLLASPARADDGPRFAVAGRATAADGTALSGRVVVTPTMPAGPAREAALDADGRFALGDLPRATIAVEVVDAAGLEVRRDGIGLPHAAPLALSAPADLRILSGIVRDAAGEPVPGATVRSWASVGDGVTVDARTTTADDGTWALRVHPEGWLRVDAPGFATSTRLVYRAQSPHAVRLARAPTVSGRVRRAGGVPVAGTSVWGRLASQEPGNPISALPTPAVLLGTTDARGAFGPLPLARGRWSVFALGAGVLSQAVAEGPTWTPGVLVEAVAGVDRTLDLEVVEAAGLSGIVVDETGRRVPGAEVVAMAPAPVQGVGSMFTAPEEPAGPAATTDAQGRFTLDALVPGRAVTLVGRRDGVPGPRSARLVPQASASAPVPLRVPVLRALEVHVVDDAGRPVEGARTSIEAGGGRRNGVTGDDGRVVLEGVPAGDVPVVVEPFGAVGVASAKASVPREGPVPVCEARVERRGSIAGRIRAPKGPVPTGLVVSVSGPLRPDRAPRNLGSDGPVRADGTFLVTGLEPGRYRLTAGTRYAAPPLEGSAEADAGAADVEILLAPGKDARGEVETPTYELRVVDPDGRPVPLADGASRAEDRGTRAFDVEAGSAVLPAEAGTARIRVRFALDANGRPLPLGPVDAEVVPKAGGRVTVTLPAERTIAGRVLGVDGRPAAGVLVRAQVPGPDPFTAFEAQDVAASVARTDAEGRFVLHQLADRAYDVEAPSAPGRLATSRPDVPAGAKDVVLSCRRAVDVTVVVVDASGKGVEGATVRWTALQPAPDPARPPAPVLPWAYDPPQRTTDARGRVRILGLDPSVRLRLDAGPPEGRGDVRAAGLAAWLPADVTVRLPFGLSIRGVIRDRDGRPVPWAQVTGWRGDESVGSDDVDSAGRFALEGLSPGPVDLTATLLGVRSAGQVDARARVEAGTEDAALVVDPGPTLVVRVEGHAFPDVDDAHRVTGRWTEARVFDDGPDGGETYGHVEGGALVFRRLRPRQPYTLWIPFTREAGGTWLETGPSLEVGERTIVLDPGAPIRGAIDRTRVRPYFWTGSGPAREHVEAVRGRVRVRGDMTNEGDIAFPPLPAGRWRVEAHVVDGAGTGRYEAAADVEAGATVALTPAPSAQR